MTRMTGGRALVKSLKAYGVDTIFCVPGVQLDAFFNALYDEGNSIRVIHNRHEQGSAYMAFGYARTTGRAGAYAVVPGPGFLNSSAGLSTAYACNAPVLCIAGQAPSALIGRGLGAHHEITDQLGVLRGLTKWAARIDHGSEAPAKVEEAFRQLSSGRVRPVGLEMAVDVLHAQSEIELRGPVAPAPPPEPDPDLIETAAEMLGKAKNPLIAVGGGASGAAEELLVLAEMLQAPVTMSRNAKGTVSDRHYLGVPESIGNRLWGDADVVLAVGTRLYEQYLGWGVDEALSIIRIDIDPTEIARNQAPALGIVSDARPGIAALIEAVGKHNIRRASREDELNAETAALEKEFDALSPQIEYIRVLRDELPDDGYVVGESTQFAYAARIAMPFYQPGHYVSPGYQGTLGYGFTTALGVKVGNPDKQVVSITGDGGFLFGAQELATAVQQRIGTVTLVVNDGAYGNVKRSQVEKYGGKVIATELHNPDFMKMADAFGAQAFRVEKPDALRDALRAGFDHDGPTLIEIPVDALPSPWHLMHLPRVRPKTT
jgi:acetolactate synthase-1/2/3 large subunit